VLGPVILGAIAVLGLALWLRLLPHRWAGVHGVDAWFYLLYAQALRRQRRVPARLAHFLLDIEEQWYPPLFPLLLAALPERVRIRRRHWVAPVIDGLQLSTLLGVAWIVGLAPAAALLAGVI
jgi:hypothetical protein